MIHFFNVLWDTIIELIKYEIKMKYVSWLTPQITVHYLPSYPIQILPSEFGQSSKSIAYRMADISDHSELLGRRSSERVNW